MNANLAERVFKAYRAGLLAPRPSLRGRDKLFDVLFRQVYWLKVPLRERLHISGIWRLSSQGLHLCREQRLEEASEAFLACWNELEKGQLSLQGGLLAKTFVESCNAYFEHRRSAFDLARARTYSSMEADLQLERDEDFSLLELHRIQSANNLMRIDLRAGEQRRALQLAGEILAYLEGFREGLTFHHSWLSCLLRYRTPRSIRCALIAQVANETAIALSCFPEHELEGALFSAIQWESFLLAPRVLHPQFRLWLLTKEAFVQKHWDQYFERLLQFLPLGRADISSVWYSAVIDFLEVCRELDSSISRYVLDGILRDAKRWPGIPPGLCSALGLAFPEEEGRHRSSYQAAGFSPSRSAAA